MRGEGEVQGASGEVDSAEEASGEVPEGEGPGPVTDRFPGSPGQ